MAERFLFSLYHMTNAGTVQAGVFAVELRENGSLARSEFQYSTDYIGRRNAIPLLPTMPLQVPSFPFSSSGEGVPGFIDELLPDAWGRRLIARTLLHQGLRRNPTLADLLSVSTVSFIGRFACAPFGAPPPVIGDGLHLIESAEVVRAAHRVDRQQATEAD